MSVRANFAPVRVIFVLYEAQLDNNTKYLSESLYLFSRKYYFAQAEIEQRI